MSDFSRPFILRPVATTLLAIGCFLAGAAAYWALPVASLPAIEFPTIRVFANRPGADPATMAASVAAPLERRLGEISGVTEITSLSSLGSTSITVQFDLDRKLDGAARDVQAALNAAATDLPGDLPMRPMFRKANSAAMPVLILALTSDNVPLSAVFDAADTVVAQRIAQIEGVAEVSVNGAEQPAIRVRLDPARLAAAGMSLEDVRAAIAAANVAAPLGSLEGSERGETLAANSQLMTPAEYRRIVVKSSRGTVVELGDIASVAQGVRNSRAAGWFNRKPAVVLIVTKQPNANVIETVDKVKALLPELQRWIPPGIAVSVLSDRTGTIRASIADMQWTLAVSIGLVMMVVFVFLRRATPTIAAGVTIPLSLAATFAAMWAAGFTIDNLSLMAITISVGFVVDDAIVMIENVHRHIEAGMDRLSAALLGARQIGFTVLSISLSLVAAFIPLFFMPGIAGRLFREFSLTLTFAIAASTVASLTVAPMICGRFMRREGERPPSRLDRLVEGGLGALLAAYGRTLAVALRHPWLMLVVMAATIGLTVQLFRVTPKGTFPQDDTGLIFGMTQGSPDISFPAMSTLQQKAAEIVLSDPAVAGTASFIGSGAGSGAAVNQGRLFISLKPLAERGVTTRQVVNRLRRKLGEVPGVRVFMVPAQDLRVGGRLGRGQYQFTVWGPDLAELQTWAPRVLAAIKRLPGVVDVATDREQGGLQARVVIDRDAAARLGVKIQDIDDALNNAFAQRQISTIYTQRNQYRVVLEVNPRDQRDPTDLARITFVPGRDGAQIPLTSFARIERTASPLVVNHQGSFPAVTITYNLAEGTTMDAASTAIRSAVAELQLPDGLRADFAGDAKDFAQSSGSQGWLILAALVAVYIILGVLYESLIHPLTIISTLPSAGLGALIALNAAGLELTIIAFIGIILLIGIVKKNGIMLVDFAIAAERERGLDPLRAIHEACLERFRPILMTTLAAIFGAIPLAVATGAGSELRRPLGITIVGGLVLSQLLTLYTTPIVYLLLDRLRRRRPRPRFKPRLAPAA